MKRYKYIGETDELTTHGKIYKVQSDGTFIDDTNTKCGLGSNFEKYFELQPSTRLKNHILYKRNIPPEFKPKMDDYLNYLKKEKYEK